MEETVKSIPVAIDSITELEELKGFLPPIDAIADEKLRQLIENAKAVRDPLVLAKYEGQTIILDGHNRYRIARSLEYTEIPAVYHDIDDLTDAKQFMIDNQLGKRNLSTKERILMVLQLEPELIAQAKARKQMTKEEKEQNSAPSDAGRTIVKLAAMAKTSRETIKQVKAVIATKNDKLIAVADTRGFSINRAFEIAEKIKVLPPEEQQAVVDAELTKGKPDTDNEIITIGEIEYTKISDFSYIYKYDGKFKVVGIATVKDKPKVISSVRVEFNQGIVELLPPYLQSWRTNLLFGVHCNDDVYDRVIREMNTLTDNIKMARKYADPELTTERNKVYATNPEFRPMTDKHKQLTEKQKQKAQTIATNIVNQIKSIDDINIKDMVKTLSHIIQLDAALVKILEKDTFNDVKFAKRLKAILENHLVYKHEMKSVLDIMTAIINRPTPSQIKKFQEQTERKAKRASDKKVRDAERLVIQKAYRHILSNTQENYFKKTTYDLVAEPDKTTRKDDIDAIMEDVRLEIEVKNTKVADVRKALTVKFETHGISLVNTKKKKTAKKPPFFSDQDLLDIKEYYQIDSKVSNKALDSLMQILKKDILEESEIKSYTLGDVFILDALQIMREKKASTPVAEPVKEGFGTMADNLKAGLTKNLKVAPKKTTKPAKKSAAPTEAPEPQAVTTKKKSAKTETAVKKATGKKSKK